MSRQASSLAALFVLAAVLGVPALACAQAAGQPLATVGGQPVTQADVEAANSEKFSALERQYQQQRRELLEGALEQTIEQRLVDLEAKARGVSREQVLAEIKPAPVTPEAIDAFYEENKAQIPQPKEQIADRIKSYLEQRGQQEASQAYYAALRQKHGVRILLEPDRVEVAATGPAKGPADAPVTIVAFSDFQCPYCARLVPTLEQVMAKYGDKVRLVFRQYPLNFHEHAQKAAEASLCANDQGKFWEYHDLLFANQGKLGVDALKQYAQQLSLNADDFSTCLTSRKHKAAVDRDIEDGRKVAVSGTPTFFVNGRAVVGAQPIESFRAVIDEELAKVQRVEKK